MTDNKYDYAFENNKQLNATQNLSINKETDFSVLNSKISQAGFFGKTEKIKKGAQQIMPAPRD